LVECNNIRPPSIKSSRISNNGKRINIIFNRQIVLNVTSNCSNLFLENSKFEAVTECLFNGTDGISIIDSAFITGDFITMKAGVYKSANQYAVDNNTETIFTV